MNTLPRLLCALTALAGLSALPAQAQTVNPLQVRSWAAACANCHGTNGRAVEGMAPLAGIPAAEISRKMKDYKSGRLPATVMHQLAKGYTDEQIDLIAAYFAAQKAN